MTFIEMKECNINEVNSNGQTLLHVAYTRKNMKYIRVLTQQSTCNLNIQDDNEDTALHIASCSEWNSAEKVQCILDSGRCDPNITNKHGHTPLHLATVNSQFDSIKTILNSTKCNPNIQDDDGDTALHKAARSLWNSVVKIECILKFDKVDVNILNGKGNTPPHVGVVLRRYSAYKSVTDVILISLTKKDILHFT